MVHLNQTCASQATSTTTNETVTVDGNNTAPCVVFNLCDKLTINMTSSQVLKLYNATKSKYSDIQSFLMQEWTNFTEKLLGETLAAENETKAGIGANAWDNYVSKSQERVSQFMDAMNSTWVEIKEISEALVDPAITKTMSGIEKKISKRFDKLAKSINKGIDAVKTSIGRQFSSAEAQPTVQPPHDSSSSQRTEHASNHPSSKPERVMKTKRGKANKKFESRLKKLIDEIRDLDAWRVDKMKRYEAEAKLIARYILTSLIRNLDLRFDYK